MSEISAAEMIEQDKESIRLTKKEWNEKLKELNLKRKEFCRITGLKYSSISNWGAKKNPFPLWLRSWLENYEAYIFLNKTTMFKEQSSNFFNKKEFSTKEEKRIFFNNLFTKYNLTKISLAVKIKCNVKTICNWGTEGKDYPEWLENWFYYYEYKNKLTQLKETYLKDLSIIDKNIAVNLEVMQYKKAFGSYEDPKIIEFLKKGNKEETKKARDELTKAKKSIQDLIDIANSKLKATPFKQIINIYK